MFDKYDLSDKCCILTGATGWLGKHIIKELDKTGCSIYALLRPLGNNGAKERYDQLKRESGCGARLKYIETVDNNFTALPDETTHIIHCAAVVDFMNDKEILDANVGLTWNLLVEASRLSKFDRFIYMGSLSIRGNGKGEYSEDSLDNKQDFITAYALTKFLAETAVKKFHKDISTTIVRLGSVLGALDGSFPVSSDWFYRTVKLWLEKKVPAFPLGPEQMIHPVPVDIAARTVCDLLSSKDVPEVLHLPCHAGSVASKIFEEMGLAINMPAPKLFYQHSDEWKECRAKLSASARRYIDGLYPPAPDNAKLSDVNSRFSEKWFNKNKIDVPKIDSAYWGRLARYIFDSCKK